MSFRFPVMTLLFFSPAAVIQSVAPDVASIDRDRILEAAEQWMKESPVTITAYRALRSAGGRNEFYSEGDYWWPNPAHPDSPYVQRDGMTNPGIFVKHREAMVRFSKAVSTLAAAFRVTGDENYARRAIAHLTAWFVNDSTKMVPHLKYGQAIKGRVTGRGIGIIDTIHLIEVARAVEVLSDARSFEERDLQGVKQWFADYLNWMTTHPYGLDERETKNNHATWWVAQVAAFARLTENHELQDFACDRFKSVLIPGQMSKDGGFHHELGRTKPYNYSIFNLEGMVLICQMLSTDKDNLWRFELPDGRGVRKAVEFLHPYLNDKSQWPYPRDVMYFEFYPARHPFLLFAGIAYQEHKYINLWKNLGPDPSNAEVQRNFPIRQPVLWVK